VTVGERRSSNNALIAYHFFPHYRTGIVRELCSSESPHYIFLGDAADPIHEVQELDITAPVIASRYVRTRSYASWRWFWQPGLLPKALLSGADTWILLSLPTNLSVWTTAAAGRVLGKNVVFWGHGWIKEYNSSRRTLRRLFFRLAKSILLYGHNAKELAIRDGFPADRLHVVYNSLDHATQLKLRAKPGEGIDFRARAAYFNRPELPTLVCTSRLTAQRDLTMAIHAMAVLKRQGLEANLLLIGDGPQREQLAALSRECGVDVHFVGACYDETKIARLMQCSELTLAPGKVGLTAIHSLTYGVPVVTHSDPSEQMPEFEAVIDGWNGVLFQRGEVNDLARAIREGLSLSHSLEQSRRRCYEVIDRFYNPAHQAQIIARAVRGEPVADDGWYEFVSARKRRGI
jgi:glycosyltransferase involved in cell wall biosynthesis